MARLTIHPGKTEGARYERRGTGPPDEGADEPRHGDPERAARPDRRHLPWAPGRQRLTASGNPGGSKLGETLDQATHRIEPRPARFGRVIAADSARWYPMPPRAK